MTEQSSVVYVLAATTLALLIATIVLAVQKNNMQQSMNGGDDLKASRAVGYTDPDGGSMSNVPDNTPFDTETIFDLGVNECADMNPKFENVDCVHLPGPQAGANVTKGYVGGLEVDYEPNLNPYWASSMCAVNVHWHLGTEHYSLGEYDENGDGPHGNILLEPASDETVPEDYKGDTESGAESYNVSDYSERLLAEEDVRGGFRCHHYDADDEKFTKPYEWKHCHNMEVGETYEVHWPHSVAGACGTINQYQTPFYDGVFCKLPVEAFLEVAKDPQNVANAVGVQAQIYTIVNDESYFYPDMMRSWIVDEVDGMAQDIAYYTGSTTGTTRNNEICSQYTPITWQVDRKCHIISASSFDKLCYDMKQQRDDMSYDTHAHGSRELVKDWMVANNQNDRKLKNNGEEIIPNDKDAADINAEQERHLRTYGHYHDHDHDEFY